MSFLIKALASIIVFGSVIFIHEFGHFIVAKLSGIKVNEFSLGMGPRLIGFTKNETEYSLRALPIGGFFAFHEDGVSEKGRTHQGKTNSQCEKHEATQGENHHFQ